MKDSNTNMHKKVAIVSCYFKHNYGSVLQAYATQKALDKLGIENETINVDGFAREIRKAKALYFIKAALTSKILLSKFGMVMNLLMKKFSKSEYAQNSRVRGQKFDAFINNYFRLSYKYSSKAELSMQCGERYYTVLVGSDQLWLPGNIAGDYYTLNFVPTSVNTIAYSTSFGQLLLPEDSAKKAKVFLNKIRHIGVREESGQKLVKELVGRKVPVVCDPTLLFTGEEWLEIQSSESIISEPYILCYLLGTNPMHREFAKRLKAVTGCKIVALVHLDEYVKSDEEYADIKPYDIDAADFLNLIRNASYVCTDSFHCSVFSVLYSKIFFAFRRHAGNSKFSTNSRLDTLFNLAGISGRLLKGDEDVNTCLDMAIDYSVVHKNIDMVRKESYQYLINALEDKESTDNA